MRPSFNPLFSPCQLHVKTPIYALKFLVDTRKNDSARAYQPLELVPGRYAHPSAKTAEISQGAAESPTKTTETSQSASLEIPDIEFDVIKGRLTRPITSADYGRVESLYYNHDDPP